MTQGTPQSTPEIPNEPLTPPPASQERSPPADAGKILNAMVERLLAAMSSGPAMNCRPHSSRQRVDLTQFTALASRSPADVLDALLGPEAKASVPADVPPVPPEILARVKPRFRRHASPPPTDAETSPLTDEQKRAAQAWDRQTSMLNKLRAIAEDARTYEQDTGVPALAVGFPLLSLPHSGVGRRVLAPLAFVPMHLSVRQGARPTIELACRGEGADRIVPNDTLLVWLSQQGGDAAKLIELFDDNEGEDPWRELRELVSHIARLTNAEIPAIFQSDIAPTELNLVPAPNADEADKLLAATILPSAVLGLYPSSNQGLLRDAQAMAAGEALHGPVRSFLYHGEALAEEETPHGPRDFSRERFVAKCDPCQMRAVRLARSSRGLVVHGPPGTGKSQTITNVVADHLARGERVLFVCDKRTALDVVYNRLDHIGLGELCALIHDPQRDRADFYRKVRQRLDDLPELKLNPKAAKTLEKIDQELADLHAELSGYHQALMQVPPAADPAISLHELIGRWLAADGSGMQLDDASLAAVKPASFQAVANAVRDSLERGHAVGWPRNEWRDAASWTLTELLGRPMDSVRQLVASMIPAAANADESANERIPPFSADAALNVQVQTRQALAARLTPLAESPTPPGVGALLRSEVSTHLAAFAAVMPHAQMLQSHGLPEASLVQALGDAAPADIRKHQEVMNQYAVDYREASARFAAAIAAATQAGASGTGNDLRATVKHWMHTESPAVQKADHVLGLLKPLADRIAAGAIDPSLHRQFRASPISVRDLNVQRATLADYAEAGRGFFGFLAFGKKNRAKPILQSYGLDVNAAAAAKLRDFLDTARLRVDLRQSMDEALPHLSLVDADDVALLSVYRANAAVLTSITHPTNVAAPATLSEQDVHPLIDTTSAAATLKALNLPLGAEQAERARVFFESLDAVRTLRTLFETWLPETVVPEDQLAASAIATHELLSIGLTLRDDQDLRTALATAVETVTFARLLEGLARSPARAAAIQKLDAALSRDGVFAQAWRHAFELRLRRGVLASPVITRLSETVPDMEAVLRVRSNLQTMPPAVADATKQLLSADASAEEALHAIRRPIHAAEIRRRLEAATQLHAADAKRLQDAFDRFRKLQNKKTDAVRDAILNDWTMRQAERLLAGTGNRLNGAGADLKRRLLIRGKRSMRLRQMVATGAGIEGGDPLFDLCPVWMASPETVASVFPREAAFDVVIFDEASQVRLEESLPVLTRAKRVLIAGDPKQLPPTRFFESSVASSEDIEAETDQDLFEAQQAETEDLLSAALGLDIQQSFLDVHYRSHDADLISFSNQQFYNSRLQPVPAHPRNRSPEPAVRLHAVGGIYEDRQNTLEAEAVVEIVRKLLNQKKPPSVGIACFNLPQRDAILEALDAAAMEDSGFATQLAAARERMGDGSIEGLFVKNLENVQGDERDHMIISTTYGPTPEGKFRRNFGPVSGAGGGRRLNVLVTRARDAVHVVTSIPASEYRNLPPVPQGSQPTGRWLLYEYLRFADTLTQHAAEEPSSDGAPTPREVTHETSSPSALVEGLAGELLRTESIGSDVYWGSDGLSIDLALQHPAETGNVTLGLLCDLTRFHGAGAEDPVEWDAFRTGIHEWQGWDLQRVWSPHVFRDVAGTQAAIARTHHAQA